MAQNSLVNPAFPPTAKTPYRPPNWNTPATTMLIYPGQQGATTQYSPAGIGGIALPAGQTTYVFDAVFRLAHNQRLQKTQHPVQTGSNISDHAYLMPARIVLEIGMSDAMASYTAGQWDSGASKSVTAYNIVLALQAFRVPLTLVTKLRNYYNMVIEDLDADDTYKTFASLKMRVTFSEVFVANTQIVTNSTLPQITDVTDLGIFTATPPTATDISSHQVTLPTQPVDIPGAGDMSSNSVFAIGQ